MKLVLTLGKFFSIILLQKHCLTFCGWIEATTRIRLCRIKSIGFSELSNSMIESITMSEWPTLRKYGRKWNMWTISDPLSLTLTQGEFSLSLFAT